MGRCAFAVDAAVEDGINPRAAVGLLPLLTGHGGGQGRDETATYSGVGTAARVATDRRRRLVVHGLLAVTLHRHHDVVRPSVAEPSSRRSDAAGMRETVGCGRR
ncbi:protein of unknown function [Blastococcus saxobsidens DD2]|uniref:Uncharacterized protein n=1 Tax=Blastococcus saxobsidens (strain DD2) TaxID=1146883 RepID=H6RLC3_BLASD|nr:protein of unknown function [Blastococcus saxobsidens DD2]